MSRKEYFLQRELQEEGKDVFKTLDSIATNFEGFEKDQLLRNLSITTIIALLTRSVIIREKRDSEYTDALPKHRRCR